MQQIHVIPNVVHVVPALSKHLSSVIVERVNKTGRKYTKPRYVRWRCDSITLFIEHVLAFKEYIIDVAHEAN